jgi:hypothetical protein
MEPLVFRAALRATARVAFTAALVGCGGALTGNEPAQREDTGAGGDDADVATNGDATPARESGSTHASREAAPPEDSGLACNAPPPNALFRTDAAASTVTESMFECCMAEIAPFIATDGSQASPDAAAADPDAVACCGAVVFAVDHQIASAFDGGQDAGEVSAFDKLGSNGRWICCDVLEWPGGPTCSPWGPPTPPEMPGEVDRPSYRDMEVA